MTFFNASIRKKVLTDFRRWNACCEFKKRKNAILIVNPDPPQAENKLPQRHQDTKKAELPFTDSDIRGSRFT